MGQLNEAIVVRAMTPVLNGDDLSFARRIREFFYVSTMSVWEREPHNMDIDRVVTFSSPEGTVRLVIRAVPGDSFASVEVKQRCFGGTSEDWQPYWEQFQLFMQQQAMELVLEPPLVFPLQ